VTASTIMPKVTPRERRQAIITNREETSGLTRFYSLNIAAVMSSVLLQCSFKNSQPTGLNSNLILRLLSLISPLRRPSV
jgi:hypothetical protein